MEQMDQQYTEHYEQPLPQPKNGMAIAALVIGIVTILFLAYVPVLGVILGVVGIILAIVARKSGVGGMAIAGLICSIIGTMWAALLTFLVCGIVWLGLTMDNWLDDFLLDFFYL